MPQNLCLGGSDLQAKAITTALSPDNRMFIQMIFMTGRHFGIDGPKSTTDETA